MKSQHTKGEWMTSDDLHLFGNSFGDDHGTGIISWVNDNRLLLATCDYSNYRLAFNLKGEEIPDFLSKESEQANAKLIAAAPDLLEALIDILKDEKRRQKELNTGSPAFRFASERIQKAQQAIKKATS